MPHQKQKPLFFIAGTLALLLCQSARAQLEGDIKDNLERPVTNAVIVMVDTLTKKADTAKVDERGYYFFTGLKPGWYRVEASAVGFVTRILRVKINEARKGSNETDDTYYAETLDIILDRPKAGR